MTAAALDLARAGLPVFPCAQDKRPLVKWKEAASRNPAIIAAWWRQHPQAMVGLPTGAASGAFVVDLDINKDTGEAVGEASFAALGLSCLLSTVPQVLTPSGGRHLYFRHPGAGFGNSAGKLGPKIDTRGEGGFVIAAGSVNGAGSYRAIAPIDWTALPDLPDALKAALGAAERPANALSPPMPAERHGWADAALREELASVLAAPEGGRNSALNRAAFKLGQVVASGHLEEETARARLAGAAASIGLPQVEAGPTIESGLKAGAQEPRSPAHSGPTPARESRAKARERQAASWAADLQDGPQPLIRDTPFGQPYPVAMLGPLREAVEAVRGMTGAPISIPAQSALAVASLAVQGFADVDVLAGSAPLSLYALTVAESGARKSSCDRSLMEGLREHEREASHAQREEMATWQNRHALWKGERERILGEAQKGKGERRLEAEVDLDALGVEPAAPPSQDRTVTEPTFEGLTRLFMVGQPSLGLFSDEGGQFLGGHAMSADNRQKTLAALNDLWGGNPIRRTRAGDGAVTLYGRRLAVHLMVQPVVARAFMADSLASGTGFLPRVLICEPASTIGTRLSATLRTDHGPVTRFAQRLRAILMHEMPMADPETRELEPRRLPLSTGARSLLTEYSDHVEARQAPGEPLAHVTGYASKSAEQAARIAGVLTLWSDLEAPQVEAETMAQGVALAEFYLSEAARLAEGAVVPPEIEQAERLRLWLAEGWTEPEVLPSDVVQKGPGRAMRDIATARKAIRTLVEAGWLVPLDPGTVVRGKSRRDAYLVVRAET